MPANPERMVKTPLSEAPKMLEVNADAKETAIVIFQEAQAKGDQSMMRNSLAFLKNDIVDRHYPKDNALIVPKEKGAGQQ